MFYSAVWTNNSVVGITLNGMCSWWKRRTTYAWKKTLGHDDIIRVSWRKKWQIIWWVNGNGIAASYAIEWKDGTAWLLDQHTTVARLLKDWVIRWKPTKTVAQIRSSRPGSPISVPCYSKSDLSERRFAQDQCWYQEKENDWQLQNDGQGWCLNARAVNDHNFEQDALGKAVSLWQWNRITAMPMSGSVCGWSDCCINRSISHTLIGRYCTVKGEGKHWKTHVIGLRYFLEKRR